MINKAHFILYVKDQQLSTEFYSNLLNKKPTLNTPGMTEFQLCENSILGLMPGSGIEKLLENKIEVIISAQVKAKTELYIVVDEVNKYMERAVDLNVQVLSLPQERDWGHKVAYILDLDQHVIGIAEIIK
ncbi:MAG: hypothetical protein KKA84_12800 [Bacteroidetes bacterium]|nr:hypothetical protein [Bacteroidota bacterium]